MPVSKMSHHRLDFVEQDISTLLLPSTVTSQHLFSANSLSALLFAPRKPSHAQNLRDVTASLQSINMDDVKKTSNSVRFREFDAKLERVVGQKYALHPCTPQYYVHTPLCMACAKM